MLRFVNKRLDFVETGIVCFVVYSRGEDAYVFEDYRRTRRCYTFFLVTRELRVMLNTHVAFFEIERRLRVAVFPAKMSTWSWSFAVRIETNVCSN